MGASWRFFLFVCRAVFPAYPDIHSIDPRIAKWVLHVDSCLFFAGPCFLHFPIFTILIHTWTRKLEPWTTPYGTVIRCFIYLSHSARVLSCVYDTFLCMLLCVFLWVCHDLSQSVRMNILARARILCSDACHVHASASLCLNVPCAQMRAHACVHEYVHCALVLILFSMRFLLLWSSLCLKFPLLCTCFPWFPSRASQSQNAASQPTILHRDK